MIGISVYTGMGDSMEKTLHYMEMAYSYGIKTVFTSLPFKAINISEGESKVLTGIHTNGMDPGEYVIRSQEARSKKTLQIISKNSLKRKKYAVTIDNEGYLRYEGELQITRKDLLADVRVNVVGDAFRLDSDL